jgi:iron-sulfur cluster assembly protein
MPPHYIKTRRPLGFLSYSRSKRAEIMTMAVARPRPQVMRLTDAAAERIKTVMAKADRPIAAVRVGVRNGGCAGMAYTMEYAEQVNPLDEVIQDKGVRILIDPKAVLFLLGTEMDYKVDRLSAQFVFNNPNPTAACGCGESVQIEPATGVEAH